MVRLYESTENYFPGLTAEQTREKLTRMSHEEYLLDVVKVHPDVVKLFQSSFHGSLVVGPDAIPAIYFRDSGFPGFAGLNIDDLPPELLVNEPGGAHGRENRAGRAVAIRTCIFRMETQPLPGCWCGHWCPA